MIHTLSREYGRRSFLVRKPRMALFLPFNIIEADIVESQKSRLFLARNISSTLPLSGIRDNVYKNTICLFLSEVLFKTLREEGAQEGLYEWCRGAILLLDALESDFSNFHLRFLLELAVQLGFAPEAEDLMPFAGEYLREVMGLSKSSFGEAMLVPLTGEQRGEIAQSLIRYIEFHSEAAVNINSLKVLRELFS